MASDGGHRRQTCRSFTGFADEGLALPNRKGLRSCRDLRTAAGQWPSRYSGGGRRLRSFCSSSPFQYLKLSSRCCIRLGRSTKAGERNGCSGFTASLHRLWLPQWLSGNGTAAFHHRALPWPSILRGTEGSWQWCRGLGGLGCGGPSLPPHLRAPEQGTSLGASSGCQPSGMAMFSPVHLEV